MRPQALMAVMGPHPHPLGDGTTHDRFQEIAEATTLADVVLFVLPDLRGVMGDTSFGDPAWGPKHRTIHSMRCMSSRLAKDGGYDWLFIVENDIELPLDCLDRLLARDKDIIVPHHHFPNMPFVSPMIFQPQPPPGARGLWAIEWSGYPATLYKMASFTEHPEMFRGGGEGKDYGQWQDWGLTAWMDLDVEAYTLELPGSVKAMYEMPGGIRIHKDKSTGALCAGEMADREPRHGGDYAAECLNCGYYAEYKPPPGYRGETLRQLGLLGKPVGQTEGNGQA